MQQRFKTQILIIGTGIAGCAAALALAEEGLEVTLVTADESMDGGNTALAQGGIVYRAEEHDPASLESDLHSAGREQNFDRAVRFLARKGPETVKRLLLDRLGIGFARTPSGELDLIREGGHSERRIIHCADHTGRVIMDALMDEVRKSPNIEVLTERTAVDLITSHHHSSLLEYRFQLENRCLGAYIFNDQDKQVETVLADYTILATGGLGQVYLHTTNTASSIGSGMVMASRAKAKTVNAEFVQFHPTALFHRAPRKFLISEAVRGAGARLVNSRGETFMDKYDERADLAPRDVVTRAIQEEMLQGDEICVYLDAANYVDLDLEKAFPTISRKCLEIGVDIGRQPIPVVPAAHYFCGGVLVDNRGRTTISRLYAAGECTCSGVHGANRLASTSLLEGLLWGWSAGNDIARLYTKKSMLPRKMTDSIPDWVSPGQEMNEDPALIAQDWSTIRHTTWNYVGITRTEARLHRAFDDMRSLYKRLQEFYKKTPISKPLVDLFHGSYAAYIVTLAAMRNKKSIGCHYRSG
jgi:L-aspartate oxidase